MNWDFPSGPGVKNLPCNAGDTGSLSGGRTKMPHAEEQLSPHTQLLSPFTLESASHNGVPAPQQKTPRDVTKTTCDATKTTCAATKTRAAK